jgi:hypothetical protein
MQAVFAQNLPAIPLYWRFELAAARADLCMPGSAGSDLSPAWNPLWNIESFFRGEVCP